MNRTSAVGFLTWGMVFRNNAQRGITEISRQSRIFLILSSLTTGVSWPCCYRTIQVGEDSKAVLIDKSSVVITLILAFELLYEPFTEKSFDGCTLIAIGTFIMAL